MSKPRLIFERRGLVLHPSDPWAQERLASYPERSPLGIDITSSRRRGKNSLYWAGLALLVQNIDDPRYPTSRLLHEGILDELHMVRPVYRIDKSILMLPDSIAFDVMEDAEFAIFFEKAQALIVARWGWSPFDAMIAQWEAKKPKF